MNSFIRSFISRRYLSTERARRALRSYMPPSPSRTNSNNNNNQRPFGFINEKNIVLGIIAVNGAVFLTWRFAYANLRSNHDQRLLSFMSKNFSRKFQEKKR